MDWTSLIKTVAPWIGTALGGPLGGLAVTAVGNALGIDKPTTDSIKQALAGVTPEQMLALKTADQQFQEQMAQLGFKDLETLAALAEDDRKDARAMQMSQRSFIPAALSVLVTVGFFGLLIGMMMGALKVSDSQALTLMLGSLSTGWGVVMSFWFGTTQDSGRKTEVLANLAGQQ